MVVVKLYAYYWWLCAKEAARGTVEWANGWAWLFGGTLAWGLLYMAGYEMALPTNMPQLLAFGLILLVAAWVGAFVVRLFGAPARLDAQKQRKITDLEDSLKPKLELIVNQNCLWVGKEPSISIGIRNLSGSTVSGIIIHLDRFIEVVSIANMPRVLRTRTHGASTFDLRPGQTEYLLIGRVSSDGRLEYEFADGQTASSRSGGYKLKIKAYADGLFPINRFVPIRFGDVGNSASIGGVEVGIDPDEEHAKIGTP